MPALGPDTVVVNVLTAGGPSVTITVSVHETVHAGSWGIVDVPGIGPVVVMVSTLGGGLVAVTITVSVHDTVQSGS